MALVRVGLNGKLGLLWYNGCVALLHRRTTPSRHGLEAVARPIARMDEGMAMRPFNQRDVRVGCKHAISKLPQQHQAHSLPALCRGNHGRIHTGWVGAKVYGLLPGAKDFAAVWVVHEHLIGKVAGRA